MSERGKAYHHSNEQQTAIKAKCFHPSGNFTPFTNEQDHQSIPERFEEVVTRYSNRVALKSFSAEYSYAQLNRLSNQIAHALLSRCAKRGEPIALFLKSDVLLIAAILGTLKAGKIYVPLDPSLPHVRLGYIVENSRASLLVTDSVCLPLSRDLSDRKLPVLNLDELDPTLSHNNPGLLISPRTPTWILYTSGSTGQPKGVVQNHRNVLHYVRNYTNAFRICPDDRLTLLFSCSANGAAHDTFSALLNGASLYPFNVKEQGPARMAEWIIQHKISIYCSVPTVFRAFAESFNSENNLQSVRLIKLIGESVAKKDVKLYQRYFSPDCVFINRLGSTETGSIRWYFINKDTFIDGNVVPVGYPVEDNEVLLLDSVGNEVAAGDIGEIAVESHYLSPGYWRRSDLTRGVFLPIKGGKRIYRTGDIGRMLPDGCLLCLGRKDSQVKIRGHRIEIAEIELALLSLEKIKAAVVLAREDQHGEQRLVAYFIPSELPGPTVTQLRNSLAETLPEYMIPSTFLSLDAFPQAPNGKVNRLALPPPTTTRPELDTPYALPRSSLEYELARIWADMLSLDRVGVDDNFFDLGGHSLLAAQLVDRVTKKFGTSLPVSTLLQAPTVEQMAGILREDEWSQTHFLWSKYPSLVVPFHPRGSKPPLFWFNWGPWDFRLPRYLGSDQPVYGLQHQSQDGHRARYTSIEQIAAHYIEGMRTVQSKGPYFLGGLCTGGMVAFEMAQQLKDEGDEVALLVLLDPSDLHRRELSLSRRAVPSVSLSMTWLRDKISRHLRELAPLNPHDQLSYFLVKVENRIGEVSGKIEWAGSKLLCEVFGHTLPLSLRARYIESIYERARAAYVPELYRGRVILFKTEGRYHANESGWENLIAGRVDIQELDTDHDNVFKEPYVQTFAKTLKALLFESQKDSPVCPASAYHDSSRAFGLNT